MTDDETVEGTGCYRHKFDGIYKTFYPGDPFFAPDWKFIHSGPCECEGKTVVECQEPGDE